MGGQPFIAPQPSLSFNCSAVASSSRTSLDDRQCQLVTNTAADNVVTSAGETQALLPRELLIEVCLHIRSAVDLRSTFASCQQLRGLRDDPQLLAAWGIAQYGPQGALLRAIKCCKPHQPKLELLNRLLSHPDVDINAREKETGWTLLIAACRVGSAAIVQLLITTFGDELDVNAFDESGSTALHCLVGANLDTRTDVLRELLSAQNLNVNVADPDVGFTPLHAACSRGDAESVALLITHPKVLVNFCDVKGSTPLHYACGYGGLRNGSLESVRVLVGCKAVDLTLPDRYNRSPKALAAMYGFHDIAQILPAA